MTDTGRVTTDAPELLGRTYGQRSDRGAGMRRTEGGTALRRKATTPARVGLLTTTTCCVLY